MSSEMRRGQEVPPPGSDRNSTQPHFVRPKGVATVQGISQSVEIRQEVPPIVAFGIPGAVFIAAIVALSTLAITESEDDKVRNS